MLPTELRKQENIKYNICTAYPPDDNQADVRFFDKKLLEYQTNFFDILLKISYECTNIIFKRIFIYFIVDKGYCDMYNIILRLKWKEMPYN